MLKSDCIHLESHDAVALIRIDLPDGEMPRNPTPAEQLQRLCQSLNEDPNLRAVILTNTPSPPKTPSPSDGGRLEPAPAKAGDGGVSPCPLTTENPRAQTRAHGRHSEELATKNLAENVYPFWHDDPNPFPQNAPDDPESTLQRRRVAAHVANLKVPTIAAIQGRAWNQGLELALACDLRLAAEDATFGFSSLAQGFIPWDGGTQRLPRIIGRARALDLLLTGRTVSAQEALDIGLVNAIVLEKDLETSAIVLARTIADAAPIAVRYLKEAVHKGLDMTLPQALHLEADLSFILQTTQDRRRGIDSFLNKTTPKFIGQ